MCFLVKKNKFILSLVVLITIISGCGSDPEKNTVSNFVSATNNTVTEKNDNNISHFVNVTDVVPDAIIEMRYYSTYNFTGKRVDGYDMPIALLTREAAQALKGASDELVKKGYRLKIYDAYRPQRAVDCFLKWADNENDVKMKNYFYPDLDKSDLFDLGYIARKSAHSRGSTVDITLFDMETGKDVDMGSTFDYFGEISQTYCKEITDEQYENRMLLQEAMVNHGFYAITEEWWHFTLLDEPYPDTYFDFSVNENNIEYIY